MFSKRTDQIDGSTDEATNSGHLAGDNVESGRVGDIRLGQDIEFKFTDNLLVGGCDR
jgi:hypothetical protein